VSQCETEAVLRRVQRVGLVATVFTFALSGCQHLKERAICSAFSDCDWATGRLGKRHIALTTLLILKCFLYYIDRESNQSKIRSGLSRSQPDSWSVDSSSVRSSCSICLLRCCPISARVPCAVHLASMTISVSI